MQHASTIELLGELFAMPAISFSPGRQELSRRQMVGLRRVARLVGQLEVVPQVDRVL